MPDCPVVVEIHVIGPPGPPGAAGGGIPLDAVTARQWQSALANQAKLDAVRDMLPANASDPVAIQWFACGYIKPPPSVDSLWNFTKTTLGYSDAQMTTLYTLAQAQVA